MHAGLLQSYMDKETIANVNDLNEGHSDTIPIIVIQLFSLLTLHFKQEYWPSLLQDTPVDIHVQEKKRKVIMAFFSLLKQNPEEKKNI